MPELAGPVAGLTGVFEPGRRNWSSSLPAGAVRKSASFSSKEPFRKPHRAVTNTSPSGGRQRNISTIREFYDAGFRTRPGFRLRHDAQRQLVGRRQALMDEAAPRRNWMFCEFRAVLCHCEGQPPYPAISNSAGQRSSHAQRIRPVATLTRDPPYAPLFGRPEGRPDEGPKDSYGLTVEVRFTSGRTGVVVAIRRERPGGAAR